MSNIRLQGNPSGTGTLTIASPNTNSDFTLNLPASAGAIPVLASVTNNGVVFINGSGQATSGSALTFDGTTLATTGKFGITGSGSIPTASALEIGTNGAGTRFRYNVPTGGEHNFTENGSVISFQTASAHGWFAGGSEQMRLTSTGLGIGTSGTTNGRLNVLAGTAATGNSLFLQNLDGTINPYLQVQHSSAGVRFVVGNSFSGANNNLIFGSTNTLNAMTLNDSGNLGLGVTPSAWFANSKALQFGQGSAVEGRTNDSTNITVGGNYYLDSAATYRYVTSNFAQRYTQAAGTHLWFTAPSGTAGNAISFTQAMTLDSGATSVGYGTLTLNGSTGAQIALQSNGAARGYIYHDGTNLQLFNLVSGAQIFSTNGTERARITSGGALLLGSTVGGADERLWVETTTADWCIQTNSTGSGTFYHISLRANGTQVGTITSTSTTTTYGTSSDYRLKENIQPMTGALAKVAALKPVTYKWKADGSDGEGFIAHELAEICPYAVVGEKDAVDENGNIEPQNIDTSFLVATLTAAIQEQQAIIEQLTTRIAALEAK